MRFLPNSDQYTEQKHHYLTDEKVEEIMQNKDLMDKIHEREAQIEAKATGTGTNGAETDVNGTDTGTTVVMNDGGTIEVDDKRMVNSTSNMEGP